MANLPPLPCHGNAAFIPRNASGVGPDELMALIIMSLFNLFAGSDSDPARLTLAEDELMAQIKKLGIWEFKNLETWNWEVFKNEKLRIKN